MLFYETATPSGSRASATTSSCLRWPHASGTSRRPSPTATTATWLRPTTWPTWRVMNKAVDQPIPQEHVVEATKTMSWANYAKAVLAG